MSGKVLFHKPERRDQQKSTSGGEVLEKIRVIKVGAAGLLRAQAPVLCAF